VMRLMTKSVIERMLDAEMGVHLDQERGRTVPKAMATPGATQAVAACVPAAEADADRAGKGSRRNRRNGKSAKTVQGESGRLTLATPRDRNGTFEPLLIPKHERRLAGFDDKVLALYAKGMSTRDIQELLKTLYGVELSATLISSLTDAVDEEVTAWTAWPAFPTRFGRPIRRPRCSFASSTWCGPRCVTSATRTARRWLVI